MGRRRKDENIYQRGKVWYIRFWYRNREYRESSKSVDRKVARALLDQRRREIEEGRFGGQVADRTTFGDLESLILRDYEMNRRKSLGSLEDRITSLRATFGKVRPVDLTHADLTGYVKMRQSEGAAAATVQYEIRVLGRMFTLAIKAGLLTTKPPLPSIRVSNARRGFFTEDEIRRVLQHLPEDLRGPIEFAYITGWRIGEVRKLTWTRHIDHDALVIRLEGDETKNEQGRTFPFTEHDSLRALIVRQLDYVQRLRVERGSLIPWLFPRANGKQLGQFHKQWKAACVAAGVPGRLIHDLRRTAARNLVRAGVPEQVAMALTGHKTRSIFDRYAIVAEDDLREGVRKLAGRA